MKKKLLSSIFISFLVVMLSIYPDKFMPSVLNGMILFIKNVAPALFPFFFLTRLLTALGCLTKISNVLGKPMTFLYNAPPVGGYVYLMSIISGYPIGSKIISDLYFEKAINESQAKLLSTFSSTSGPLFIIGTIGYFTFNNSFLGYCILICHILGAMTNGLLYRQNNKSTNIIYNPSNKNLDSILSESMKSAVSSVLVVGGYISIFSMMIDIFEFLKIIQFISTIIYAPLQYLGFNRESCVGICQSLLEITRGCNTIAHSNIPLKLTFPTVSILLSFGGLSIGLQSLAFLSRCKIKASFYFLTKLTQGIITLILSVIVSLFL